MKRIGIVLSALLAAALLVWMLGDGRLTDALVRLFSIPPAIAAAIIASQAFSYYCRARRISDEFSRTVAIPFRQYLRISLLHNFSVNVVPFRGGELMLPYLLRRAGIPGMRAVATLIWLRMQDAIVLASLAVLLWPDLPLWLRALAGASMVLGVIVFRITSAHLRAPRRWPKLQHAFDALTEALDAPVSSWLWSITNWITKLFGLSLLLHALIDAPLVTTSLGALGGELSAMLPVQGMGGFGTYEAGVAFGLLHGVGDWTTMLVPAFAVHSFTLLFAAFSGVFAWFALPDISPATAPAALPADSDSEKNS